MAEDRPMIGENLKQERASWRERLDAETNELEVKVKNLEGFINSGAYYGIHDDEKGMLNSQLGHMKAYLQILNTRKSHHKEQSR